MEENIKNLIETMIYYGLSIRNESIELMIRMFNYKKGKDWVDELVNAFPSNHPARNYYNKVSNKNFDEIQLIAFAKMAMWEIKANVDNWDFVYNEEQVDRFVEEIYKMDNNHIKEFIKKYEKILIDTPKKFRFYFAVLYFYLTSKKENSNNIEYLKNEVDLIDKCEFGSLFDNDDEIVEKYRYLLKTYDDLTWELAEEKEYDLAEEYYKKYINFLEKYLESNPNSYKARNYLASAYSGYGYILEDVVEGVNDSSNELIYKAISIREKLVEEYPNKKAYQYERIAVIYNNMAYQYKKAYKKDNIEEYKEKYYELYKKSINYREELIKLDEFKELDKKINNYNELGRMYYFLFEDDKAKENYNLALEICKNEYNSNEKWIEKINKELNKLKEKQFERNQRKNNYMELDDYKLQYRKQVSMEQDSIKSKDPNIDQVIYQILNS